MSGAKVVIVDYGMGNVGSIANMLRKLGSRAIISHDKNEIAAASRIILPGVGAFAEGMRRLQERDLIEVLDKKVSAGTPVLGICLGMQLMTKYSEEGDVKGLGWIDGHTVRFKQSEERMKVPHMGWNEAKPAREHSLLSGLENDSRFYFVHSYHVELEDQSQLLTNTHYYYDFVSGVSRDNITGVQFHPEKSHRYGLAILRNFLALN